MWDIHDIQDGYVHGEGLQNGTESQVGKDQMGGENEKREKEERQETVARWRERSRMKRADKESIQANKKP